MSDLQLALLAIGAVVIAGVYAFNWWQERQFQRRVEQAFENKPDDVLLGAAATAPATSAGGQRIEPTIGPVAADEPDTGGNDAALPAAIDDPIVEIAAADAGEIDYSVTLTSERPLAAARLSGLLDKLTGCDKLVHGAILDEAGGTWLDLAGAAGTASRKARLSLQLADRSGPVGPEALEAFSSGAQAIARELGAKLAAPDPEEALAQALELDRFCIEADIAIGLNVIARGRAQFAGSKVRALAESLGFELEASGTFRYAGADARGAFALDNREPQPFLPERLDAVSTQGLTLLLDVPNCADAPRAFDRMVEIGRQLAAGLGGDLVDDNRVALSEAAIGKIRTQLDAACTRMEAHGIAPGSARARRLFS